MIGSKILTKNLIVSMLFIFCSQLYSIKVSDDLKNCYQGQHKTHPFTIKLEKCPKPLIISVAVYEDGNSKRGKLVKTINALLHDKKKTVVLDVFDNIKIMNYSTNKTHIFVTLYDASGDFQNVESVLQKEIDDFVKDAASGFSNSLTLRICNFTIQSSNEIMIPYPSVLHEFLEKQWKLERKHSNK